MDATWIDSRRLARKKNSFLNMKEKFAKGVDFVDLPKALIRYKDAGKGSDTIAFVPDPPNTLEHYDDLSSLLEKDFRVIVFELPGFGFSLPASSAFSFTLQEGVETTIAFFDYLGLKNIHLAFPCVSGYIALKVAEQRPDLVKNIICIQTPSWEEEKKWAKRIDFKGLIGRPYIGQFLMMTLKRWIARKWYQNALPKNKYNPSFLAICNHAFNKGAHFCLSSGLQAFFKNKAPAFMKSEKKGFVVWGSADRSHKHTDKNSSQTLFQTCSSVDFEHAGHFPELECPREFAQLLKKNC